MWRGAGGCEGDLFIDRTRPGGMIISLQVNDNHCANFCSRSSLCCCNSLLLTQHQSSFTHALLPRIRTWMRISSWKLDYLTQLSACLPLIIRGRDSQTWSISAARRHVAVLQQERSRCNSILPPPVQLSGSPRLLAGRVVRLNAWSTKISNSLVFKLPPKTSQVGE